MYPPVGWFAGTPVAQAGVLPNGHTFQEDSMNRQNPNKHVFTAFDYASFLKAICLASALLGVNTAFAASPKLVGTWKASIQLTDCSSGQQLASPFTVVATYYADGNVTEVPYSDPATRTSSYGRWVKTGKNVFAASSQFGIFDVNGFYAGYQVLERMLTMSGDAQTYRIRARTSRYGLSDELLFTTCATGTGERLPGPKEF
jgi:hypothetical protein